jgi:hypothetical protein
VCSLDPSLPGSTGSGDAVPTPGSLGAVDLGVTKLGSWATLVHRPHLSARGRWKATQSRRVHGLLP